MMVLLVLLCGMCQVPLRKSDQCRCVCWLCTSDGKRRSPIRSFDGWPQPVGSFLVHYIDSSHPLIDFIFINLSSHQLVNLSILLSHQLSHLINFVISSLCHLINFVISSTLSSHQLINLSILSSHQLCQLVNFVISSTLSTHQLRQHTDGIVYHIIIVFQHVYISQSLALFTGLCFSQVKCHL